MNPITNMKNLNKMNERELEMGLAGTKQSWHYEYKDSAWVFIGGLPYELTGKYIYEFKADIFIAFCLFSLLMTTSPKEYSKKSLYGALDTSVFLKILTILCRRYFNINSGLNFQRAM